MKYLKNNQSLKIVSDDAKGVISGVIKSMSPVSFVVSVDSSDTSILNIGEIFEIIISDETCIISFETRVEEIKESLVCFSMPEQFKLIQRREYPRVDISIPLNIKDISDNSDKIAITKNISGGGLRAKSHNNFKPGSLVETQFKVLNVKNINTILEILRVEPSENPSEYYLSGRFKEITNADRIALIQLCFKRQLELKCKGVSK